MKKVLYISLAISLIFFSLPPDALANEQTKLQISAPSAILMDYASGKIIYEKNPDEKLPLASVTKIMTMLLAMEEIEKGTMTYDDIITASAHAKSYGGSTIFLDEGEQMTVRDILKGIAVASGNDAAVAMGEHISGTESLFVEKMNKRSKELGMNNTHFVNCNGLDADGHYSTARDIAIMSRELMKHKDIFSFTSIWMDSLRNGEFTLSNTNKLVRFYDGCTGLKTGSTSKAKFCISATAKRNNMHLIAVIMAADTSKQRQADASSLLNYGFSSYTSSDVIKKDTQIAKVKVAKSSVKSVDIITASDYSHLSKKSDNVKIETKKKIKKKNAPIKKGDDAGYLKVIIDGEEKERIKLVYASDAPKASYGFVLKNLIFESLS